MKKNIRRGGVYWTDFGENTSGHEQHGLRPALVVQNDTGNRYSTTTVVVPITRARKSALPTHVTLDGGIGTACAEQLRVVDKSRIFDYRAGVSDAQMAEIVRSLRVAVGNVGVPAEGAPKRGDVFMVDYGHSPGCEMYGCVPSVVVQNDRGNTHAPTTIVVPLLKPRSRKRHLPTHVDVVFNGKRRQAACEQVRVIDKSRLKAYVDGVAPEKMQEIESCIVKNAK